MFSNDLPCLVSLDALGPSIPSNDIAIGIQHENGVVADRLHEQAEAFFTVRQHTVGFWR